MPLRSAGFSISKGPQRNFMFTIAHTPSCIVLCLSRSLTDHADVWSCPALLQSLYLFHSGVFSHPWPPPLALFPSGVLGWSGEGPFINGLPNHGSEIWMDLSKRKACPSFVHSNCHPLAVQYLVRDVYVGRILGKGVLLLTNRGLFHLRGPNLRLR